MRGGFRLIAAIIAVALLLIVAIALLHGVMGLAKLSTVDAAPEPDPMFAEPAEQVTRPPESDEDEKPVVTEGDDPSLNWVYEELTPVEKTAAELANGQ